MCEYKYCIHFENDMNLNPFHKKKEILEPHQLFHPTFKRPIKTQTLLLESYLKPLLQ